MLFRPPFDVSSGYLCFPQIGGSSHSLNFDTFRDTAPLSFDPPDVICKVVRYCAKELGQSPRTQICSGATVHDLIASASKVRLSCFQS